MCASPDLLSTGALPLEASVGRSGMPRVLRKLHLASTQSAKAALLRLGSDEEKLDLCSLSPVQNADVLDFVTSGAVSAARQRANMVDRRMCGRCAEQRRSDTDPRRLAK